MVACNMRELGRPRIRVTLRHTHRTSTYHTCRMRSHLSLVTLCRLKASEATTDASGSTSASMDMDSQVLGGGGGCGGGKGRDFRHGHNRGDEAYGFWILGNDTRDMV